MKVLDVLTDPQIASLMELLGSLSGTADPRQALADMTSDLRFRGTPAARALVTMHAAGGHAYAIERLLSEDGVQIPSEQDTTNRPPKGLIGGLIGDLIRTPQPKIVNQLDLTYDPVLPPEMAVHRAAMAVPIFSDQNARDWILLFHRDNDAFGVRDLRELILRTNLVSAIAGNIEMAQQLFHANLKIQAEINQIAEIQQALLPEEIPHIPGLRIAANYQPMGEAGGDLYDIVPLAQGGWEDPRFAMLIGDVSGHGASSAVAMAMIHSIIHAFPRRPEGPGDVLTFVNQHLCSKRLGRLFTTAFLAFYDPTTRVLSYARAGHNPPLLLKAASDRCLPLEQIGDLPLGIDPTALYGSGSLQLASGDQLLLYTDGISEARNMHGEQFEVRRLEGALLTRPPGPETLIRRIRQALIDHADGARITDDQTLVAIHVE